MSLNGVSFPQSLSSPSLLPLSLSLSLCLLSTMMWATLFYHMLLPLCSASPRAWSNGARWSWVETSNAVSQSKSFLFWVVYIRYFVTETESWPTHFDTCVWSGSDCPSMQGHWPDSHRQVDARGTGISSQDWKQEARGLILELCWNQEPVWTSEVCPNRSSGQRGSILAKLDRVREGRSRVAQLSGTIEGGRMNFTELMSGRCSHTFLTRFCRGRHHPYKGSSVRQTAVVF